MKTGIFLFLFFAQTLLSIPCVAQEKTVSIGSYSNGCLKNGMALDREGIGYQSVRFSRKRYYGHSALIRYIKLLAKKTQSFWKNQKSEYITSLSNSMHLPKKASFVLGIGDLSSQSGGPTLGNHQSHQNGLDVDIWFTPVPSSISQNERESLKMGSMVTEDGKSVSKAFTQKQILLLKTAASIKGVDRIFVHPSIKQALCQLKEEDKSWIRKIRPWYGHRSHFHVRLSCPKDSLSLCKAQSTLPPSDGCGKELASFLNPKETPQNDSTEKMPLPKPKVSPKPCEELWASTSIFPEKRVQKPETAKPQEGTLTLTSTTQDPTLSSIEKKPEERDPI